MKLFPSIIVVLFSLITAWSCSKEQKDKKKPPTDKLADSFSLVGQKCLSSFQFHPGENDQEEITPPKTAGIDMKVVHGLLTGAGLIGYMHAALPEYNSWIFNYQQGSFFNTYQFPLVIADAKILEIAKTLKRHDKVKIKGSILENVAAQKHLIVTEIEVLEAYESSELEANQTHTQQTPDELVNGHSAIVGVHSITADGTSLTVEYRDFVVQVVVKDPQLIKGLYRNDKIRINYNAAKVAGRPLHLVLDESTEKPLEVLDRLVEMHGRTATVEGCLVLFPKSPQINRDIFALLEIDKNGIIRTWTLTNFVDSDVLDEFSKNLADHWTSQKSNAVNFRNKMLNAGIHVSAKGMLNISSPNQANPQILIAAASDLVLEDAAK